MNDSTQEVDTKYNTGSFLIDVSTAQGDFEDITIDDVGIQESERNNAVNQTSINHLNSDKSKDPFDALGNIPTPEIRVFDVAAYILENTGPITTMKLHKLLYYCQAWSLVWDESPLFKDKIEAWANGPVIRTLFNYHKGMYEISAVPSGNSNLIKGPQKETVDAVLAYYGDKSSQWLINLTHLEDPWKDARSGLSYTERGNKEITHAAMMEYYSGLV